MGFRKVPVHRRKVFDAIQRDKQAIEEAREKSFTYTTPIDERTPNICKEAIGKHFMGIAHDTGDPTNPCRCTGVPID